MKLNLILLSSLAMISAAGAQTVVDITGSTAGRSAVNAQILAILTGETYAYDAASLNASARVIYTGTYLGNPYIVRCYWSGSVNGVRDVAQQIQQSNFYDKSVAGTVAGTTVAFSGGNVAPVSAETAPEIGYSDVFQTSTAFSSPSLTVEDEVGIIPFKWFKNEGASAGLTNVTPAAARYLYGFGGEAPLHIFTGVPADTSLVYVTGRNADSGSRITTMAETGFGVFASVTQYTGTVTGNAITAITGPANTGFGSGSNVATLLGGTYGSGDFIGYLGASDWSGAVTAGAVELAWNGVAYSEAAVRTGKYTFWGYLHQNRMALAGNSLTFYNKLRDELKLAPGSGLLIDDATFLVERAGDGAPVTAK